MPSKRAFRFLPQHSRTGERQNRPRTNLGRSRAPKNARVIEILNRLSQTAKTAEEFARYVNARKYLRLAGQFIDGAFKKLVVMWRRAKDGKEQREIFAFAL